MTLPVYVYDPTSSDTASKVRGVGSYVQTYHENFGNEFTFVNNVKTISKNGIFIQPFYNLMQKPDRWFTRISRKQIAVIHDVIPLKFPQYFPTGFWTKFHLFIHKTFALKLYDVIITDSHHSKRDIVKYLKIPAQKVYVVYPTVKHIFERPMALSDSYDSSIVDPEKDPQFATHYHATHVDIHQQTQSILPSIPFQDFCIYVGDGTWNKNLITLANAVIAAQIPCVIVGKAFTDFRARMQQAQGKLPQIHPWEKSLLKFCQMTMNNPLFYFTGFVSDHDLVSLYKKAKVNVLVSYDEGFGLSYLEASYLGTPSVLADTPLFHETAAQDGIFANVSDYNEVADKIRKLFFQQDMYDHSRVDVFERAYDFAPHVFRERILGIVSQLQK
jgi:glycosyltransferase involved in cell wall biosynthesis